MPDQNPEMGSADNSTELRSRDYFADENANVAFNKAFLEHVGKLQKQTVAKYLRPENIQRFRHGGEWTHPGLPTATGGGMKEHSALVETKFEDIVNHDLGMIERVERGLLDEMERQFAQMMYATAFDACEKSGNTVDAKTKGSFAEAFLATLEKIEFAADRNENVKLPEIHVHPDMAARMVAALEAAPPELKARLEEVKARKTAEAIERERLRKSKFARYKISE